MLLSCQICQCIKRSPGKNGQPESLWNVLFEWFREWGTLSAVVFPVSIFLFFLFHRKCTCPHVDLDLRSREVSGNEMQTHLMNWKGNVLKSLQETVLLSCFCPTCQFLWWKPPPASETSQLRKSMKWGRNLSLTGPGTVPSTAQRFLLPLRGLNTDSNSAKP